MNTPFRVAFLLLLCGATLAPAQVTGDFDLAAYTRFLSDHRNLERAQLLSMYPAGKFEALVPSASGSPAYLDTIDLRYALTPYEKDLLARHGFMVTSRLSRHTMVEAFGEIWQYDLPVFVSTDAILEAVHISYDNVLKEVEKSLLAPRLQTLLGSLRQQVPVLAARYSAETRMQQMVRDVDVYLTVAHSLLLQPVSPYFIENEALVQDMLNDVAAQKPKDVALFASTSRIMDFSQFIVRGHYTKDSLLSHYFRSMIWLGRTELMLLAPLGTTTDWPLEDIQRQAIDALLIAEAVTAAGAAPDIAALDSLITFLVGEQDNVTLENLAAVRDQAGIVGADELLDTAKLSAFQSKLLEKSFAFQRINSQIIMTDPCDPTQVRPSSAFLLLGQRFVIDSYITGNVVYDKILFNGNKVARMLPSTLDVLFALGNDASAQLLQNELDQYKYGTNLAALRYLVNSYDETFWGGSLFNSWLRMLRMLNPPADRTALPAFMQTAAWWQEKMNTQLASWAQLRHDNLLYAKQSYTPGIICSYPESYVEPFPAFFSALKEFAGIAAERFGSMGLTMIESYYRSVTGTADTLAMIAQKELSGTSLLPSEKQFLRRMLLAESMCGSQYYGWYPGLFYGAMFIPHDTERLTDFAVADVHTAPTDASGAPVGWVLHAGTGPVDLAILVSLTADGKECAFVGPVLSYYEHLATGFKRFTDEEWATVFAIAPSLRPLFVNLYLADSNGQSRGNGPTLLTSVGEDRQGRLPTAYWLSQNYPNPFNPSTCFALTVSGSAPGHRIRLEIFDVQGRLVATLLNSELSDGNYTIWWNGKTLTGTVAATGVYFCRVTGPAATVARKMVLLR